MKHKALKKGISVILAVVICLSSLLGAGVPTVHAAPVQEEVIPIAYPREGDANFSADWGHDTLHFMNGWTIPAATQFTFRAMGLYSGTICYCIEPGVAQTPGDILTQFGEDFWENYPADYNSTIAPYDIKLLIGRIFQYGYTGNVSSYWYSQEESGEFIANAIATQLVIWETVVGERDSDFNHVDPGPYDAVLDIVRSGHPLREKILSYYNSIVSNVQMHSKLPSFMSKTTGKAQNIELVWNGSQYTAVLTDTNGVLENYTFAANDPGVTVAVSGNVLTLSAPIAPSGPVSITADKKNPKRSGVVVWSDGVINPSGTIQDVAVYSAEVTDPIKGYLNAKVSYGSVKIVKTSEDGIIEGLTFTVTGDGYSNNVALDSTGTVLIENLKPGNYTVTEQTPDRYESQAAQSVTVVSGQTVTVSFDNTLKRGSLKVTKTSEDGLVEGVQFKLTGTSLSGSAVELYAVTDTAGVATFPDVLISGNTPYVLEEISTAERYIVPNPQNVTIHWNAVTEASVHNALKRGSLKVTKNSEDGLVEGVRFKLSGTSLSGQKVEMYAQTNASGVAVFAYVLISGSTPYVLEEVDTEGRYIVPDTQNVTIAWNTVSETTVDNTLKRGGLKVTKTSEDGLVEGVRFKLTGTSLSGHAVELYAVTDAAGVATFTDVLISGSAPYVLEEVETGERYIVPDAQNVTIEWNTVAEASVYNELKRGDVKVTKEAEDGLVSGVRFHLTGTSLSGAKIDLYATTGEDGVAVFENVLIGTNYTLEEVNTSTRYVIPEAQSVTVNWNAVTECTVKNILKKFRIEVLKVDANLYFGEEDDDMELLSVSPMSESPAKEYVDYLGWPFGEAQGDATLAGAVYGFYQNGVLLDTYTTDEYGYFVTDYYPCGNGYYLQEISASEGYLVDTGRYYIYASPNSYTQELNTQYQAVYEDIIRGQIEIAKHTDDGETGHETPEAGAVFEVYLKSAGSYDAAEEWERDIMVIGDDGFAMSKKLPYGVYVVTQVAGWEGRDMIPAFEVTIVEHEYVYRYIINNAEFESYIKVAKTDATTGKTIPYAGAAFQIYDPEGNLVTMQYTYPQVTVVDTFYTTADGTLVTPEKLPYGKGYSLVEVQATDGYVLDSAPVYFDVMWDTSAVEDSIIVVNVVKGNMPQMGTVTITKTGEVFASVEEKGGLYQPVFETAGLEGAVFEIFAAEDIVTPDGTVRYTKGEKVDTITTGADGKAASKELYLGKYHMQEIKAPYGMLLNGETVAFELTYAGQEVSVTSTAVSMTNERQKIVLDLVKVMEQDETFKLGMNGEISKVSFGLYAKETLTAADGAQIPKDGLLEIVQCDIEGKAVFTTDVPVGSKLYVKEHATDPAYVPTETSYPVEFVYAGQEIAAVVITVNNGEAIRNELIRGSVEGLKLDEDGKAVAGAEFGLFWPDTTEFTKENAILIATSDDAGVFYFDNLPALKFIVKELSAPVQYVISDEAFEVQVTGDGQVITIEAVNEFVTGGVTATKTDKDTAEKLSGAVFEVYIDANGDKVFDEEVDTLYGVLTETGNGVYSLEGLRYGGYFLLESQSPAYYIPNDEYHYFAITEDGKTIAIETTAGKGFENEAYKGTLKVIKKDAATGELLSGVEFGLFDSEGNEIAIGITDDAGELSFEKIRFGKYELLELTAKDGYQKADRITFVEITRDGQVITVELTNEKIPEPPVPDNPKTGDDTDFTLWIGLMLIGLSGVVFLAVFGYRKKRARKEPKA